MPVSRASSLPLLLLSSFVTSLILALPIAHAADTKDNAGTALDRVNAHASANPQDLQAMFIRAVTLAEQNHRDEAIKAFTEITEKYPNLPEPYNNLAVLYSDQGQYDKARKALESAIKTHPSYATAHENLGDIYAKMASEAYDKALQLDTSNVRAQSKLLLIKEIFTGGKPLDTTKASTKDVARPPSVASVAVPPPATIAPATPAIPAIPSAKIDKPLVAVNPAPASKLPENKQPDTKLAEAKPADAKSTESKPAESKSAETKTATPSKPAAAENSNGDTRELNSAVMQWAKAWSSKDVNRYLDSYANSFQTPDGLSRKAWELTRRQRIDKPGAINVEVTNIKVKQETANRAVVNFKQSYRSAGIAQRTNKALTMVRVNGKWLIEQERTDR